MVELVFSNLNGAVVCLSHVLYMSCSLASVGFSAEVPSYAQQELLSAIGRDPVVKVYSAQIPPTLF